MKGMKKITLLVLVCIITVNLAGCNRQKTMLGYVYESYAKSPISGITIQVDDQQITTDSKGAYSIELEKTNKVNVTIQSEKYVTFQDWVVVPDIKNYRDFILDAAHPFGIKADEFQIPTEYSYEIRQGVSETKLQFIGTVDSIVVDESMRITGKQYNPDGKLVPVQSIKIGLSGFETDELGYWNMYEVPTDLQLKLSAKESFLTDLAYYFYADPEYTYEKKQDTVNIGKTSCVQFMVTEKVTKKGYDIFLIQDGPEKGLVKRIVQNDQADQEYTMITFTAYYVEKIIEPPVITE